MNSITCIDHVGIRVNGTNYQKSREFYEKLGFVWIVGPIGPEPVAILKHKASGITLNLIINANAGIEKKEEESNSNDGDDDDGDDNKKSNNNNNDDDDEKNNNNKPYNVLMDDKQYKYPGITHIALRVPDIDLVEKELEDAGIVIQDRMKFPGGGQAIFVRDPDRTTIEFNQPGPSKK